MQTVISDNSVSGFVKHTPNEDCGPCQYPERRDYLCNIVLIDRHKVMQVTV
jgi:hypothetical protein